MLLLASYVFYGFWDWRFLSLIFISTVVDYFCGLYIYESASIQKRKKFLLFSIVANLSLLGFFKYFNFFATSLSDLLNLFGLPVDMRYLHIILPVGISFYTFQTLSYTIDIYRGQMKPTKKFFDFALFVAFFPQLIAGPIERARRLLPQILSPRTVTLSKFHEGCFLIFWGLFEKIFIADNLAKIVDSVFAAQPPYGGSKVLIALYAFTFQIFCDFDGYSNIARGLGKCMGFEIMVNFHLPYFAANPVAFWRRWHISLSTWLRDYLYIPLGGNHRSEWMTCRNIAVTMILGGLWHGAALTFTLWGAYHGFLLIVHRRMCSFTSKRIKFRKISPVIRIIVFFHLFVLGLLIFRAQSISQIGQMLHALVLHFDITNQEVSLFLKFAMFVWPLFLVQWGQVKTKNLMFLYTRHWAIKTFTYALMTYLIIGWGVMSREEFYYFQF